MNRFRTAVILAAGLGWAGFAGARLPDDPPACDLATIASLDYCPGCQIPVEKEALNKKGEHVDCETRPVKADFCLKTFHLCAACGARAEGPGKCATCKTNLVPQVAKSKIVYRCKNCAGRSDQPKACDQEGCEGKGKPYAKTCADSGAPPHVRKK